MKNQKGNTNIIISVLVVVIIIGFIVYGFIYKNKTKDVNPINNIENKYNNQTEEKLQEDIKLENKNNMEQNNKRILNGFTPITKINSLEKVDLVVGTGEEVKSGATVSVHYTGAIASTGEIFQSSKDFGVNPITFPLDGVIKGWTDGIPGMKVGGIRRLIIPSFMAYGTTPPPGSGIPANADLVFDVELVAVKQ